ncbi:DUF2164 domain-containing protein [Bacillaceae bacterium Marseille-Q3522]|nr:DUF2164 domain-containing protein [Bacillaceae bacterium Marseille-Q3522]
MYPLKIANEQKQAIIENIQVYFQNEFSEELGQLAAENLFAFMLEALSPFVYNQALRDARTIFEQQMAAFEEELYALERPIEHRNK